MAERPAMSNTSNQPKQERVEQALADYMRRVDAGEPVDRAVFLAAHPDLADELGAFFEDADVIGRIANGPPRQAHRSSGRLDEERRSTESSTEHAAGQCAEGPRVAGIPFDGLCVRCPHCHQPIEILPNDLASDVTCAVCGSTFNLLNETPGTYTMPTLTKVSHFELIDRLGVGAHGSVWKARDTELDRAVAVKIPRKDKIEPQDVGKFLREARAAAQLRHPNIVSVFEVGREADTVFIVSELIRGVSLADWMTGRKPTARETAALGRKIALALHHAHEAGIIHRDLKPGNILMDEHDEPHIADFGLAKRELGEVTMTVDGHILGTPAYMPPEQARGEAHSADRRSDVYSLGAVLFEMLTGERPFRGNSRMLLHQVLTEDAPSPRTLNATIPRDLDTIVLKCLEKSPIKRYATAADLAEELTRFLEGQPIHARPISRVERGWRWCLRNRAVAVLVFLIVASLVTGAIISISFAIDARNQTDKVAQRNRELVRAELETSQIVQLLLGDVTRRDGKGGRKLSDFRDLQSKLLADAVNGPRELVVRHALGRVWIELKQYDQALDQFQAALRLIEHAPEADQENVLLMRNNVATMYQVQGRFAEALEMRKETISLIRERLGPSHPYLERARLNLVSSQLQAGHFDEALSGLRATMNIGRPIQSVDENLLKSIDLSAEASRELATAKEKRDSRATDKCFSDLQQLLADVIQGTEDALRKAATRESLEALHELAEALWQTNESKTGERKPPQLAVELLERTLELQELSLKDDADGVLESKLNSTLSLIKMKRRLGQSKEALQLLMPARQRAIHSSQIGRSHKLTFELELELAKLEIGRLRSKAVTPPVEPD